MKTIQQLPQLPELPLTIITWFIADCIHINKIFKIMLNQTQIQNMQYATHWADQKQTDIV